MTRAALLLAVLALAGCPHHGERDKPTHKDDARVASAIDAGDGSGDIAIPPSPPLPAVPAGLPPLPDTPAIAAVTPDAVAFGARLFSDPRLSASGKTSCAACHDPAHGFSGGIDTAADGKPNLRRTPALANLAWAPAFHWDGRYTSLDDELRAHLHGQLGGTIEDVTPRLREVPLYRAYLAKQDVVTALAAFVLTRYEGDGAWDRREATAKSPKPGVTPDVELAGYLLFTGKAQCAVCHTPPLYTDFGYHRVGKVSADAGDQGRGRVDADLSGAFKTPTLRGAARRTSLFHTGDTKSLADAIAWYDKLGRSASHGINPLVMDPAIAGISLTAGEQAQLLAFVQALTSAPPPPSP